MCAMYVVHTLLCTFYIWIVWIQTALLFHQAVLNTLNTKIHFVKRLFNTEGKVTKHACYGHLYLPLYTSSLHFPQGN